MREIRSPGLMSGDWKRSYGANCDTGSGESRRSTALPRSLRPPRQSSTLLASTSRFWTKVEGCDRTLRIMGSSLILAGRVGSSVMPEITDVCLSASMAPDFAGSFSRLSHYADATCWRSKVLHSRLMVRPPRFRRI